MGNKYGKQIWETNMGNKYGNYTNIRKIKNINIRKCVCLHLHFIFIIVSVIIVCVIIMVIIMVTRRDTLFPLLYCRDFLGYGTL